MATHGCDTQEVLGGWLGGLFDSVSSIYRNGVTPVPIGPCMEWFVSLANI
jgi:hypothetical protein